MVITLLFKPLKVFLAKCPFSGELCNLVAMELVFLLLAIRLGAGIFYL